MKPSLQKGKLIKWKDKRGFGFIQPADGRQEVFLHISDIEDATRRPQVGDTIYYRLISEEDNKVRASQAFILGARNKPNPLSSQTKSKNLNKHPFPIVGLILLSIVPLVGSVHLAKTTANLIPLIFYPAMSLLTFGLYAEDKSRAKRNAWRIAESTLHLCELAGGWPGGFVAQRKLRHKSIKRSYQIVFWAIVGLHMAFWLDWLVSGGMLAGALMDSTLGR